MSNQPNPYEPYGYDHYDQAPRSGAYARGLAEKVFGPAIGATLRNPVIATAALLLTGAAFAGIIVFSYPDSSDTSNVPVIKAETTAFKEVPSDPGGMVVPHQDSTIFMQMGDAGITERPPVENLLEQEDPVDKVAEFEKEAAASAAAEPAAGVTEITASETPPAEITTSTDETAAAAATVASAEKPKLEVQKIIQEEEIIPPAEVAEAEASAVPPQRLHAPASSPETIAFVRSVLDKKDAAAEGQPVAEVARAQQANIEATTATEAAAVDPITRIEPASGDASAPVAKSSGGTHYIQVGSVKTSDGADSEWKKIQKSFSELQGMEYRVKEANLGDRGTFFRIQAGPVSKESANSICDSIKTQKPGGCLVVSQ